MNLTVSTPTTLTDAVAAVAAARAAGNVPLFVDPRAGADFHTHVLASAATATINNHIAWACTTSGTSGGLRIVGRTAQSWSRSFPLLDLVLGMQPGSRIQVTTPPHSSMTVFSIAFAAERGHELVSDGRADLLHGAPHHLQNVLESGDPLPRRALIGGAALDSALRAQAEAAGIRVFSYYGATELSLVALDSGAGLRAFPEVNLAVRNGVVWAQSPFIAEGYLVGDGPFAKDGPWASVGDRGTLRDGSLKLAGRGDDALLSASATIVPAELEAQLRAIHGVRDAAITGIAHKRLGVLVGALVEPTPGSTLDVATLREALRTRVAPSHLPRVWRIGPVPRTAAGKVRRVDVDAAFQNGSVDA